MWGDLNLRQRLEFWGVPFRCSKCHIIGHLKENCNRLRWDKFFKRNKQFKLNSPELKHKDLPGGRNSINSWSPSRGTSK